MRTPVAKKAKQPKGARLVVRHYCQGIGDCHLLGFPKADGTMFWMMIDCGVHSSVTGGPDFMERVVADVVARTEGKVDVLVITHEHWDHVSAFLTAAERFTGLKVGEVWTSWAEDPDNPLAQELDKFKAQAQALAQRASSALRPNFQPSPLRDEVRQGLEALAGFQFGAAGEKVRKARDAGIALGRKKTKYFTPAQKPFDLPGVDNVRVYVLGPPPDPNLLKVTVQQAEIYGLAPRPMGPGQALSSAPGLALISEGAAQSDYAAPFDPALGSPFDASLGPGAGSARSEVAPEIAAFVRDHYTGSELDRAGRPIDLSWRRIDSDWLAAGADFALQLDSRTNNTSLALAFEFTDTGRVALFAADAQVGNWLSWMKLEWTIDGQKRQMTDLYPNVVYYKVGHHGSENATLRAKGLELMTHADLSAFVPTNAADAIKVKWGQMPFTPMMRVLIAKTKGRAVRADDQWIARKAKSTPKEIVGGSILDATYEPGLWVQFDVA